MAYSVGVLQDAFRYSEPTGGGLIRNYIAGNQGLYTTVVVERRPDQGIFPQLKTLLLQEAILFLDKALYQYCIYKHLVGSRHFGWAEVTAYYASFFAVCALLRFQGVALSRIRKGDTEVNVEVNADDLLVNSFRIHRMRTSMHEALWRKFADVYMGFGHRRDEYEIAYPMVEPGAELEMRNAVNYRPDGYEEIYMRSRKLGVLAREREPDAFMNPQLALGDSFLRKEVVAGLRIRLGCELTRMIAESSSHGDAFEAVAARRREFLRCHCRNERIRRRLEGWVEGRNY